MALSSLVLLVLAVDFAKQYVEQATLTRIESRLKRHLDSGVTIVRLPGSIVVYRQGVAGAIAVITAKQEVQALTIASTALGTIIPLRSKHESVV